MKGDNKNWKRTYFGKKHPNIINNTPQLNEEIFLDVVIIGAGFTGISTSYHLQEKGICTAVLEKHTVGWEQVVEMVV